MAENNTETQDKVENDTETKDSDILSDDEENHEDPKEDDPADDNSDAGSKERDEATCKGSVRVMIQAWGRSQASKIIRQPTFE